MGSAVGKNRDMIINLLIRSTKQSSRTNTVQMQTNMTQQRETDLHFSAVEPHHSGSSPQLWPGITPEYLTAGVIYAAFWSEQLGPHHFLKALTK